jgi:hypothetical protein
MRSILLKLMTVTALAVAALQVPVSQAAFADTGTTGDTANQCSLTIADRTGPWVCADETPVTVTSSNGARKMGSSVTITPDSLPTEGGGWCDAGANDTGCYERPDSTTADAHVAGTYGYSTKVLGEVDYSLVWKLSGYTLSKMQGTWESTGSVTGFIYEGQLDWVSSNTDGASVGPVAGSYRQSSSRSIAKKTSFTWNYGQRFDDAHSNYTGELGPSWGVSGYPGFWWMNVRSPIYHCSDSRTVVCQFTVNLPAKPITGGYNA